MILTQNKYIIAKERVSMRRLKTTVNSIQISVRRSEGILDAQFNNRIHKAACADLDLNLDLVRLV